MLCINIGEKIDYLKIWENRNVSFDKCNKKLYNEYTKGSNIAKYYEKEIPSL